LLHVVQVGLFGDHFPVFGYLTQGVRSGQTPYKLYAKGRSHWEHMQQEPQLYTRFNKCVLGFRDYRWQHCWQKQWHAWQAAFAQRCKHDHATCSACDPCWLCCGCFFLPPTGNTTLAHTPLAALRHALVLLLSRCC
jgi:hypothetical protein